MKNTLIKIVLNIFKVFEHLVPQFSEGVLLPTLRVMTDGVVSLAIISLLAYLNPNTFFIFVSILTVFAFLYLVFLSNKSNIYGKKSNQETKKLIQSLE